MVEWIFARSMRCVRPYLVSCTDNVTEANNRQDNSQPLGTIQGVVTDAYTTLPVQGATVSTFIGNKVVTATTDTTGKYSLAALPANSSYMISYTATGYAVTELLDSLPGTVGYPQGNAVVVQDAQIYQKNGQIQGTVFGAGGAPLAGVAISWQLTAISTNLLPLTSTTDNTGNFSINIPLGQASVLIEAFTSNGTSYKISTRNLTTTAARPDLITTIDLSQLTVAPPPTGTVTGLVCNTAIDYNTTVLDLQWNLDTGAYGYRVYAKNNKNSPNYIQLGADVINNLNLFVASTDTLRALFSQYNTGTTVPFMDTTQVTIEVVPINKDRVEGTASQAATITLKDVTPPAGRSPRKRSATRAVSRYKQYGEHHRYLTFTVTVDFSEYMDVGAPQPVITINDAGGVAQSSLVASNWAWQDRQFSPPLR